MILDTTTRPHQLKADTGKKLYDNTVDIVAEERYYFTIAYVPDFFTIEDCLSRYTEVEVALYSTIGEI